MEANQIKEAQFLDILFDGRNKEYGAYELRKTYNRRIVKSMVVMGSVVALVLVGGVVMGFTKGKRVVMMPRETEFILDRVVEPTTPPPPKPIVPVLQQVAQIRMTTVQVVPDKDVKPDEKPPENDDANHMKIGTDNKVGDASDDVVGPPVSNGVGAGVVEQPKKADPDEIFTIVEIDASFPGGLPAWARFLNKNLRYPEEAMSQGIGGMVVVQFVVDVDGNVSDVRAISGPETGGLREEAERVIKRSGKWEPAVQNGRHVKAYRRQPVTFKTDVEN